MTPVQLTGVKEESINCVHTAENVYSQEDASAPQTHQSVLEISMNTEIRRSSVGRNS